LGDVGIDVKLTMDFILVANIRTKFNWIGTGPNGKLP
jgi:hypothetical protein